MASTDKPHRLLWSTGIIAFVVGIVAFVLRGVNVAGTLFDMMVALCTWGLATATLAVPPALTSNMVKSGDIPRQPSCRHLPSNRRTSDPSPPSFPGAV